MYVVQQPHSLTNSSDKFRVTEFKDWRDAEPSVVPFESEWSTYREAEKRRDELNKRPQ